MLAKGYTEVFLLNLETTLTEPTEAPKISI